MIKNVQEQFSYQGQKFTIFTGRGDQLKALSSRQEQVVEKTAKLLSVVEQHVKSSGHRNLLSHIILSGEETQCATLRLQVELSHLEHKPNFSSVIKPGAEGFAIQFGDDGVRAEVIARAEGLRHDANVKVQTEKGYRSLLDLPL